MECCILKVESMAATLCAIECEVLAMTKFNKQDAIDSAEEPKIIQILIGPDSATWQGKLIGLGSDGVTYEAGADSRWHPILPNIGYKCDSVLASHDEPQDQFLGETDPIEPRDHFMNEEKLPFNKLESWQRDLFNGLRSNNRQVFAQAWQDAFPEYEPEYESEDDSIVRVLPKEGGV